MLCTDFDQPLKIARSGKCGVIVWRRSAAIGSGLVKHLIAAGLGTGRKHSDVLANNV